MSGIGDRLREVARRKERLIARADAQRALLADGFYRLSAPIGIVERGVELGRQLLAHPLVIVGGVAILVALRRREAASLAVRVYAGWRAWRAISAWWLR